MKPKRSANQAKEARGVLRLTLHRQFFDEIAAGRKKTEYRGDKTYWRSGLVGRDYAEVEFRNGYATDAPLMRVECRGIGKDGPRRFAIRLGEVLEIRNYEQRP